MDGTVLAGAAGVTLEIVLGTADPRALKPLPALAVTPC
jgi:hypothetical protein